MYANSLPMAPGFDSTLQLLADPYRFISKTCTALSATLFQTRIMLEQTVCMTGPEAAELFYDETKFERKGAMPGRIKKTLLGEGGVQGLDGHAHQHRKEMFMSLMVPGGIENLRRYMLEEWDSSAIQWPTRDRVILYDEVRPMLCRAVCRWAGVPLADDEIHRRTEDLTAMFQFAGSVGLKHWQARFARQRAEKWAAELVDQIRAGAIELEQDAAAFKIATHRDHNGEMLDRQIAAVEILNILRPVVAISVFIVFAALALHEHPEAASRLEEGADPHMFVQEVRRFYPFFPAVVSRVRQDFDWQGYRFPRGRRVMLDLYGTNHDPVLWADPHSFRPERHRLKSPSAFELIPQGGGDSFMGHRCAGEAVTIALLCDAVSFLAKRLDYMVPPQNLALAMKKLPALPESRLVLESIRLRV